MANHEPGVLSSLPVALREKVVADAIEQMCRGLNGVVMFLPAFPLLVAVTMWGETDHVALVAWVVFAFVPPATRLLIARRYLRTNPVPAEAPRWANWITLTALGDGVIWGVAGVAFFSMESVTHRFFIMTIAVGISAGSIFITSFWPRTQYAYSLPALLPVSARLFLAGDSSSIAFGVALLVYLVILFRLEADAHRATLNGIVMRYENRSLVEQLREQNDVARLAKETAEQANLAKSKFLAAASHDLRQPLHALSLFATALHERLRNHDALPLVRNIERSVNALETLFTALLDISKLDAGVIKPETRNVNLRHLLDLINQEYAPQATSKGLAFQCTGTDIVALTDPALLETVLRNLVSNAIRYTENGSVSIRYATDGNQVIVDVSDTGIGIAREHQIEIFREFFQVHNPERDRTKGLGLGLAIVNRLTHLLDVPLEVRSVPGKGSTFRLYLPAGDADRVVDVDAPGSVAAIDESGARVLVIDDEQDVRTAMTILLEDWGYTVITAGSLDEALARTDRAPDVIIADYRLRDEHTGADAIRGVASHFGREVPALIVTGDTDPTRIGQAKQSGYAFLHKPVAPAKLRAFLRMAVRPSPARGDDAPHNR